MYQTRAVLLARLKQYEKDIRKMNDVANAGARAQGYCDAWENIIKKINKETEGRLSLKGRPGHAEVDYIPNELSPPHRRIRIPGTTA